MYFWPVIFHVSVGSHGHHLAIFFLGAILVLHHVFCCWAQVLVTDYASCWWSLDLSFSHSLVKWDWQLLSDMSCDIGSLHTSCDIVSLHTCDIGSLYTSRDIGSLYTWHWLFVHMSEKVPSYNSTSWSSVVEVFEPHQAIGVYILYIVGFVCFVWKPVHLQISLILSHLFKVWY